ncbi:hypothetical protein MHBO_004347 [Bonamia ostreae]|uniref:Uncharacterized protein n=1 Tax=Bonamia ostreae TaxID=126728 RepID=A0ABV2AT20_9EUKA
MERDGQTNLQFQLTVPFGCVFKNPQDDIPIPCFLEVRMVVPKSSCSGQGISGIEKCGVSVKSTEWNMTQTLTIKHKNTLDYEITEKYYVFLNASAPSTTGKYWGNARLSGIEVSI